MGGWGHKAWQGVGTETRRLLRDNQPVLTRGSEVTRDEYVRSDRESKGSGEGPRPGFGRQLAGTGVG